MSDKLQIQDRFQQNLERVRHLVAMYEGIAGAGQGRRPIPISDVLRAATVFLHAALEDLLRSIEAWKLPSVANDATLDGVPLVGSSGRPERFLLGRLAAHRGKTVDDLIAASVRAHLERRSYSDTDEMCAALQRLDLNVAPVVPFLASLAALTKRRHDIVHRADRDDSGGQGNHSAKTIGKNTVYSWIGAVEGAGTAILAQL